jgi:anti-sigma-K factor RskA
MTGSRRSVKNNGTCCELDQIERCAGLRQTRSTQKATSFWRVYSLLATAASATLVLVATAIVRDCGHVLA